MSGLTVLRVKSAKTGRYADGNGLYLLVGPSGARSWMLRVQVMHRRRDIGLGSVSDFTLVEARERAARLRKIARAGGDPILERDQGKKAPPPSFKVAALACHAEATKRLTPKNAAAFKSVLETYAFPVIGQVRVDSVDAAQVRDVLTPVWTAKPSLADKLRVRVAQVLDFAKEEGWRVTETPRGSALKRLGKMGEKGHFSALPHAAVPGYIAELRSKPVTMGRLALLFTILTAARNGEVRSASWSHIDLEAKIWTRPAALMKSNKDHVVTLSCAAVAVLKQAMKLRTTLVDCLIFPGVGGRLMSDMTMSRETRPHGITVHGFRSSFRDWAAEEMPTIPDPVAEAALAHSVSDAVVAAYKRTPFIDMRRKLLDAWGDYCDGRDNVLRLVG